MKHVLAIDAGTTGVTCLMIGDDGRVAGRGYREIPQYFPEPGWVEHDAIEILECVRAAARDAIARCGRASPTRSASRTSARRSSLWERATGKPVHRAIVWQDRRTAARCAGARAGAATGSTRAPDSSSIRTSRRRSSSGCCAMSGCCDRYRRERSRGRDDRQLARLAAHRRRRARDRPDNASRTMLYDIDRSTGATELCELFGVPSDMLPEVRPSSGDFGVAKRRAPRHRERQSSASPAISRPRCSARAAGRRDRQEHVRHGRVPAVERRAPRVRRRRSGLLTTIACDAAGRTGLRARGADLHRRRGGAVAARRTRHHRHRGGDRSARAIARRPTTACTSCPALTGLGAPHWEIGRARHDRRAHARNGRAHLARAALEAMAYATADVLDSMSSAQAGRRSTASVSTAARRRTTG